MPQSQNLFWIVFAISCVLLVPLVFVTPVRFPLMALVLLLCHHPTYSSSSIVLGLILFCFVILYITAAVWMNESMEGIPNASLAVVILCGVLLVLRRSFFIMARQAWQVHVLSNGHGTMPCVSQQHAFYQIIAMCPSGHWL